MGFFSIKMTPIGSNHPGSLLLLCHHDHILLLLDHLLLLAFPSPALGVGGGHQVARLAEPPKASDQIDPIHPPDRSLAW